MTLFAPPLAFHTMEHRPGKRPESGKQLLQLSVNLSSHRLIFKQGPKNDH